MSRIEQHLANNYDSQNARCHPNAFVGRWPTTGIPSVWNGRREYCPSGFNRGFPFEPQLEMHQHNGSKDTSNIVKIGGFNFQLRFEALGVVLWATRPPPHPNTHPRSVGNRPHNAFIRPVSFVEWIHMYFTCTAFVYPWRLKIQCKRRDAWPEGRVIT